MRERGLEVTTAANYDEAMEAAETHPFELAVVDLRMPGKGGLEVVRDLHERYLDLKIVVLTGYGSISTAVDALRLGAVNYMQKPADADDILTAFERITQILRRKVTANADPSSRSGNRRSHSWRPHLWQ